MTSPEPLVSVRQQLAVLLICLVATLACSGAVTVAALLTYVLPACLAAGLLGLWLSRATGRGAAAGLSALAALGLAQLTNLTAGDTSGPVARSTFLTAAGTATAVVLTRHAAPLLVAAPVGGVLGAALWLGAADEVVPVLGAVVALLVLILPSLARAERREASVRRRLVVPLVALLTVGAAVAADRIQDARTTEPPVVFEAAQVDAGIAPPGQDKPAATSAKPTATASGPPPISRDDGTLPPWWALVLAAVTAGLLCALLRVVWVAQRWRRRRRRLRRGDPASSTLGAWHWTLEQLRAYGLPVPFNVPPDEVALGRHAIGLAGDPLRHIRPLAERAAFAGFSAGRPPSVDDAEAAWDLSDAVVTAVRDSVPRTLLVISRLR